MSTPTIFETCRPREDVLSGAVADADFAADLGRARPRGLGVRRPRAVLRRHLPDEGPQEPSRERLPAPVRRWG